MPGLVKYNKGGKLKVSSKTMTVSPPDGYHWMEERGYGGWESFFLSLAFGATVLLVDVGDLGHQPLSLTHIRASAGVLGVEVLAPLLHQLDLGLLACLFHRDSNGCLLCW